MKMILVMLIFAAFVGPQTNIARADSDENLETLIEAAKKLEWATPENKAILLIKQETVVAPVGLIFGYVDNAAACAEIIEALNNPVRIGTFKCESVE